MYSAPSESGVLYCTDSPAWVMTAWTQSSGKTISVVPANGVYFSVTQAAMPRVHPC